MTIIEQLRQAISQYTGPLPATGNSIEELWFRQAFQQLLALERGGPTVANPQRPYCKPEQTCCDFTCGN